MNEAEMKRKSDPKYDEDLVNLRTVKKLILDMLFDKNTISIPIKIKLQSLSDLYTTFKTFETKIPIDIIKTAGLIRMNIVFTIDSASDQSYVEIIRDKLILHLTSDDRNTIGNNGRIWIESDDLLNTYRKYKPAYPDGSITDPDYSKTYIKIWLDEYKLYIVLDQRANQLGVRKAAFSYVAENND